MKPVLLDAFHIQEDSEFCCTCVREQYHFQHPRGQIFLVHADDSPSGFSSYFCRVHLPENARVFEPLNSCS